MDGFACLEAVAARLALDTVDTDQIFPSRFMTRNRKDGGFGRYFLHDLRFTADGETRPDFVLNQPLLATASILVAGATYGIGSGRPGAVLSHLDFGIRVVIAESFGPVFSAVAYKSGLLTISLPRDIVTALRHEVSSVLGTSLTVDLRREVLTSPGGVHARFTVDPFVKAIIMGGTSEVELTLSKAAQISAFEHGHRSKLPWIFEEREL